MIRLEMVPIGEKVGWLEEELRVTTPGHHCRYKCRQWPLTLCNPSPHIGSSTSTKFVARRRCLARLGRGVGASSRVSSAGISQPLITTTAGCQERAGRKGCGKAMIPRSNQNRVEDVFRVGIISPSIYSASDRLGRG